MEGAIPTFTERPLIIVVGPTGRGKSTAMVNLDPKSTAIINTENKPLPFKGNIAKKFKNHRVVLDPERVIDGIKYYANLPEIETIVLDSFSAWGDEMYKRARKVKTGWDVQNYYNEFVKKLFDTAKESNKFVIFIGHPEMTNTAHGETVKAMKVKGKEWEGVTEKEATIVLYATMEADGEGNNKYFFQTQSDGITNAKSPMGMFNDYLIPNDYKLVIDSIKNYYSE